MAKITIEFPNRKKQEFEQSITPKEIAKSISQNLAKEAIAAEFNGKLTDITTPLKTNGKIKIITFNDEEGKKIFWHSSSHLMAQAVKRLYPEARLSIGPAIENGFYYDFDNLDINEDNLKEIEKEMKNISEEDLKITREEKTIEEAKKLFINEPYKLELIESLEKQGEKTVSVYRQGEFFDLCRGPHIPSTSHIKAFTLTKIAGAYWRGDSNNKMLKRIYGISFTKKSDLDKYLFQIKEAKKRDHKKLGKELDIFMTSEEGPGFPFFLPHGTIIYNRLIEFWREEHKAAGYKEIMTPMILNRRLWEKSGHWDHYKDNMYFTKIDEEDYSIKPMNCPGGILVYQSEKHSYRDLPLRIGEIGLVHRHEMSGVLNGLFRVRAFHQDDAHIFMLPEQIKKEIKGVANLIDKFYKIFGFEYEVELSTKPENSIGSDEIWESATNSLKEALDDLKFDYKINEGDGAFYGPKIDFHIKDSLGRKWQCGTIQLDFAMPERFKLTYMGKDGTENHRPVMLHRVIYGSLERFIGILIEHYGGKFPLWLSPRQIKIVSISDKQEEYAKKISKFFSEKGYSTDTDTRTESIGKKIREAQLEKTRYIIVVGEKEKNEGTINIRDGYTNKILGTKKPEEFEKELITMIKEKAL